MEKTTKRLGSTVAYYVGSDQSSAGIEAFEDLKALRESHAELAETLRELKSHIDVSTIRPGIKHEREWGSLKQAAEIALANAGL